MGGARNQRFRLADASLRLHKGRHAPQAFLDVNSQRTCPKILDASKACRTRIVKRIPFSDVAGLTVVKLSRQSQQDGSVHLIDINVASPECSVKASRRS